MKRCHDTVIFTSKFWSYLAHEDDGRIFVSSGFNVAVCCDSATAMFYAISCCIGPHYIDRWLLLAGTIVYQSELLSIAVFQDKHMGLIPVRIGFIILAHAAPFALVGWLLVTTKTMVTSSNGNIFHVTGPLWGESIGQRWIPLTKASDAELWCFLWSAPE